MNRPTTSVPPLQSFIFQHSTPSTSQLYHVTNLLYSTTSLLSDYISHRVHYDLPLGASAQDALHYSTDHGPTPRATSSGSSSTNVNILPTHVQPHDESPNPAADLQRIFAPDEFDLPPERDDDFVDPHEIDLLTDNDSSVLPANNDNNRNDVDAGQSAGTKGKGSKGKGSKGKSSKGSGSKSNGSTVNSSKGTSSCGRVPQDKLNLDTRRWVRAVEKFWLHIQMPVYRAADIKSEVINKILVQFFRDFPERAIPGVDFDDVSFFTSMTPPQRELWNKWHQVRYVHMLTLLYTHTTPACLYVVSKI
jgi:hypothetical protein